MMMNSNPVVERVDRSPSQGWLRRVGRLAAPFIGLFLVLAIFTAIEPGSFPTVRNGQTIAVQTVVVGIGALGMCFVIVCGRGLHSGLIQFQPCLLKHSDPMGC